MFIGGFGTYVITVIISWFIQRNIVQSTPGNRQLSETLFILLFIPVANIILSVVFFLAKEQNVNMDWIRKNVYRLKD
jgi:hypothetical protein